MHRRFCIALLIAAASSLPSFAQAQALRDNFDRRVLDLRNWSAQQIETGQISFQQPGRCGAAAIVVTIRPTDGGSACEACQRAEVRVAMQHQPKYGDETWTAFSFRIQGDMPRDGSARNVIGQFKGPMDSSPFIAQRFDNGVFHITVEDNGVRRMIAKSEGDPDQMVKAQQALNAIEPQDVRSRTVLRNLQAIHRIARTTPDIAALLFVPDAQAGLKMPTGRDWTRTTGDKVNQLFGMAGDDTALALRELVNVTEIDRYAGPSSLTITPGPGAVLPDPREGWVDMVYRIRGGRTDNLHGPKHPGEIDVWANGRLVVSVRGNVGPRLTAPPPDTAQYFKFGIYRDARAFEQRMIFDEFAQGASQRDVALACAR